MFDYHTLPASNWGIYPILFRIGKFEVTSYAVFMLGGLLAGLAFYYFSSKKDQVLNQHSSIILLTAIITGTLGAKIPEWIANYDFIFASLPNVEPLLSGRTIVGGLLGGSIGVLVVKKVLGIHDRRGNQFAPGIALGMAIGRIGCFLAGCCYGIPTTLPWAVDFGDGILRHPTQLYESLFCFGLFVYLLWRRNKITGPGLLFRRFMTLYLLFRFIIEFIRVEPILLWGMSGYQLACIIGIIYVYRDSWINCIYKIFDYKLKRKVV